MIKTYTVESDFHKAEDFLNAFIRELSAGGLDKDALFDIKLSLGEALVNAIKYGNKHAHALTVTVHTHVKKDSVMIEVKDQGKGFDFRTLQDPTKNENLTKGGGRGVFLIKKLMDKVEFLDNGSRVRMVKSIKA
jgi:serine/threonine-protein kinase RsbW